MPQVTDAEMLAYVAKALATVDSGQEAIDAAVDECLERQRRVSALVQEQGHAGLQCVLMQMFVNHEPEAIVTPFERLVSRYAARPIGQEDAMQIARTVLEFVSEDSFRNMITATHSYGSTKISLDQFCAAVGKLVKGRTRIDENNVSVSMVQLTLCYLFTLVHRSEMALDVIGHRVTPEEVEFRKRACQTEITPTQELLFQLLLCPTGISEYQYKEMLVYIFSTHELHLLLRTILCTV